VDFLNVGRRAHDSRLLLSAGATLLRTENVTEAGLFRGNELPYAPELQARAALDWVGRRGFELGFEALYSAEQFADQANTVDANAAGTIGVIPSYTLCNLRARYRFEHAGAELFLNANNVLDRQYLASRAPDGSFPGAFRQVLAGVRWTF
jgi:outer membrane receptor protein involved in Fe transport